MTDHAGLIVAFRELAADRRYDISPAVRGSLATAASAIASLVKERDEARARCARLEEALRPFAAEAEARANLALGPDIDHWPIGGSSLTLGDLRRARQALEEQG